MPRGRRKKFKLNFNIKPDTARSIAAMIFLSFAILSVIAFFAPGYAFNAKIFNLLRYLFGQPAVLLPFLFAIIGLLLIQNITLKIKEPRIAAGLLLALLSLAGLFHTFIKQDAALEMAKKGFGGGIVGYKISGILIGSVSIYGTVVVLFAGVIISAFLLFDLSLDRVFAFALKIKEKIHIQLPFGKKEDSEKAGEMEEVEIASGVSVPFGNTPVNTSPHFEAEYEEEDPFEIVPTMSEPQSSTTSILDDHTTTISNISPMGFLSTPSNRIWEEPPVDLLTEAPPEIKDIADAKAKEKIIVDTLKSFGIDVEIASTKVGSSVTQYALRTKSVTKVSKIASLQENLALALASPTGSVRVEAPIPGKSEIGIEVPNINRTTVFFKSILTSDPMKGIKSKLAIGLGKDVAGRTFVYDIAKMPHLLIAGATGSGKSVFIHNILFSILFRASPQEVKFILVDPKRTELIYYQDIPHLLTPVITDMDKAPSAFKWAVQEMERRYKLFEQAKVRNIEAYNENSGIQVMPYIVLIVDEFAEIMLRDTNTVEKSVIRIAQLARATGIHLVLAVQRPSTNIITGIIKANIPCRAAFNVASQVDSRVILDQPGAEKLLGKGDMLFIPPDMPKPIRLQAAYISDKEISNLVTFLKGQGVSPEYVKDVTEMAGERDGSSSNSSWGEDVDPLFDEAVEIVTSLGKASASLLQRKLAIGFSRAARIIDQMEEKGVVGPAEGGSKAREILLDNIMPVPGDLPEEFL